MNSSENSPSTSEGDFEAAIEVLNMAGLRFHYLMWLPEGQWWLVAYKHGENRQQMFHAKASTVVACAYFITAKWQAFEIQYGWPPKYPVPIHLIKPSSLKLDIKI